MKKLIVTVFALICTVIACAQHVSQAQAQATPTSLPSIYPTIAPTSYPTTAPTTYPTTAPTTIPAYATSVPTTYPTTAPTAYPTTAPTAYPTVLPGTPPPIAAVFHGCTVFAANDAFNWYVGDQPVDPNSDALMQSLIDANPASPAPTAVVANSLAYAINVADGTTPAYTLTNSTNGTTVHGITSFPYLDSFQYENKGSAAHGDRHLMVLNTATCHEYESYVYNSVGEPPSTYTVSGAQLQQAAPYGSEWDLTQPLPAPRSGGVNLAQTPYFAGIIRWDDYMSGCICHELNIDVKAHTINNTCYVAPAYGTASTCVVSSYYTGPASDAANALPDGAHLRLKQSYQMLCSPPCPQTQMILTALKSYGGYVMDTGGYPIYFYLGATQDASGNWIFPWTWSDVVHLDQVPLTAFEVIAPKGCTSLAACVR